MFHSKEGWFWKRLDDGSVLTQLRQDAVEDGKILAEHVIDASGWASIIASVSLGGEEHERFYAAGDFHASAGPIRVVAK